MTNSMYLCYFILQNQEQRQTFILNAHQVTKSFIPDMILQRLDSNSSEYKIDVPYSNSLGTEEFCMLHCFGFWNISI